MKAGLGDDESTLDKIEGCAEGVCEARSMDVLGGVCDVGKIYQCPLVC